MALSLCGLLSLCRGLVFLGGLFTLLLCFARALTFTAFRGSPKGKIVAQKLHDKRAVPVGLFGQRIELGNGIIKCLLREVASALGRVEDLVVEDREVQGQTKTNWVRWSQLRLRNIRRGLDATSQLKALLW